MRTAELNTLVDPNDLPRIGKSTTYTRRNQENPKLGGEKPAKREPRERQDITWR